MSESAPVCELGIPGVQPHGPGWYLLAANSRVEAGPFACMGDAERAAEWMDEQVRGVNPAPWKPIYSPHGLTVGNRWRPPRRPAQHA